MQRRLFLAALTLILINCIQAWLTPLINDEAYYWVWSQHLDWGYFDHPPMVAAWIKLGFSLFQNELGVRLITILANGIAFCLLGNMLAPKTQRQFWLFTTLFGSVVLFQAFGFITTPDSPLLFFSIVYLFFLKRFLEKQSILNTISLGLGMALVLYSKYHGVLIIGFSVLPLIPKLYKNPKAYWAVLVGIICFLPHLYWQYENDFISVNYHLIRRNVHNHFKISNTTDYLLSLIWASSPLLFYFLGKAIFKFKHKTLFQQSLQWIFFGVIGFFLIVTLKRYIQAQWSLVAFVPLIYITYLYFKENEKAQKWIFRLGAATAVLFILVRVYFIAQDVPYKTQYHGWKDFMIKVGEKTEGIAVFEKYQYTSLFNFYNYPDKHAENFITIENRHSQYELWDSEENLNQQNITYFSKNIRGEDSLMLHSREDNLYKIRKIKDFKTVYKAEFNITDYQMDSDRNLTLKATLTNHHNRPISISQEEGFKVKIIAPSEAYSHNIKCIIDVEMEPIKLEAHESKEVTLTTQLCDIHGTFPCYLGIIYDDVPPKIQSNRIEINLP